MIEALKKTLGIVSRACDMVGISQKTHYEWLQKDAEYKSDVEAVAEMAIDFAESKLLANINNGDTTSIIFFLKKKGRARGYGDEATVLKIEKGQEIEKGFSLDDILDESQIEHLKNLRSPSK